jgi:hypothetical protein
VTDVVRSRSWLQIECGERRGDGVEFVENGWRFEVVFVSFDEAESIWVTRPRLGNPLSAAAPMAALARESPDIGSPSGRRGRRR